MSTVAMDIVILGPGSANLDVAAAVAQGLRLPVEAVVQRIYRSPSRLLLGLPVKTAQRIVEVLRDAGFEAEAMPANTTLDDPILLDVAAEILDPAQIEVVAPILGAFLGLTAADALELLHTPPGLILGSASPAAIAALEKRLPPGALRLLVSSPALARYALFTQDIADIRKPILKDLISEASTIDYAEGLVAFDLDRATADKVWRYLKNVHGLRIVDQAFLRCDLQLLALDPHDTAAVAKLGQLTDIPSDIIPELALLLPVAIEEGLAFDEVQDRLKLYRDAGLLVAAKLTNFRLLAIDVLHAPPGVLAALGMGTARPPIRTPHMTDSRARHLRHKLESAGAEVVFVEVEA